LGLLVSDNFGLDLFNEDDTSRISYLFAYTGLLGALVQGGATGRLVKMMGEPKLIIVSLLLVSASFGMLPFVSTWGGLLFGLGLLAIGASMTRPPVFGMISVLAGSHEQGATLGVAQGMGSLSRIIGPIFAGALYGLQPSLPYLICGAVLVVTAVLVWIFLARSAPVTPESAPTADVKS
jgi:MFS family permease